MGSVARMAVSVRSRASRRPAPRWDRTESTTTTASTPPPYCSPKGIRYCQSTRNYETTVGFEWTLNNLTDGKKALIAGYWPFVSLDVRHRTIYDYARVDACDPEDGQWSFNVLWGLRPVCTELHSEGAPELLRSPLLRREPPRPVSKPFKLPYVRFRDARAGVMVWVALAHWLAPGRTVGAITRSPGEETSDAL